MISHAIVLIAQFMLLLVPTHEQESWISNDCGIRQVKTVGTDDAGQWPWHVAVYRARRAIRQLEYTCGGTLISDKFVLTAGRCVLDEHLRELNASLLAVRLGVQNLRKPSLKHGRFRRVVRVELMSGIRNKQSVLALLGLSRSVEFGSYIQPICIYQGFMEDVRDGTMISWSLTKTTMRPSLHKSVELSVLHPSTCSELSDWLLCGGYSNVTEINQSDTGGGFFIEREDIWYLIGILIQLPDGQNYAGFQEGIEYIQRLKASTNISYLEDIKQLKIQTEELESSALQDFASRLPKQCGNFIPSRVYDDIHSEVYEFPWIALVGYRRLHYVYRPLFSCSGSLINRRYVLTSGACVSHGKM